MKLVIILYSILLYQFSITNAYAYLDPGTGSIILQALLGLIALIGVQYRRLIDFFKNKKKNKDKTNK